MKFLNQKLYSLLNIKYKLEHGFIALTSAIIISFLLITITLSLGLSSFLGRFDILDSESKEKSLALAEACANQAILDSSYSTFYSSPLIVSVNSDNCTIISSENSGDQIIIKTQAVVNESFTNLKVIIDSGSFSIISWKECANFGGSC